MHPVTGSYSIDAQAKASAQLYLKPDSRSDLHGETLAISDSDGRTVVFTLDQNTAANVRNSPTDYTIGIGAYSSYMNGQNHAAAVYSGIKLAYDMGDLGVRPSNDGTTQLLSVYVKEHFRNEHEGRARITLHKVPATGAAITLKSTKGETQTYTAVANGTSPDASSGQFESGGSANSTTTSELASTLDSLRSAITNSGGLYKFPHYIFSEIRSRLSIAIGTGQGNSGISTKTHLPSDTAKYTITLSRNGSALYNFIIYFRNDAGASDTLAPTQDVSNGRPIFGNVTEAEWISDGTTPRAHTAGSLSSGTVQLNIDLRHNDSSSSLDTYYDSRVAYALYYAWYYLTRTDPGINGVNLYGLGFSYDTTGLSGPTGFRGVAWEGPHGATANNTNEYTWSVTVNQADTNQASRFLIDNLDKNNPHMDLEQYMAGPRGNTPIKVAGDTHASFEIRGNGYRASNFHRVIGTHYNSVTGSTTSGDPAAYFTGGKFSDWYYGIQLESGYWPIADSPDNVTGAENHGRIIGSPKTTSNSKHSSGGLINQYFGKVGPVSYTHLTLPTKRIV